MNDINSNLSIFYRLGNISNAALKRRDRALRIMANTAQSDLKSIIEQQRIKDKKDVKDPISFEEEVTGINSLINRLTKGTAIEGDNNFIPKDIEDYIHFLKQFQPPQLSKDRIKEILKEHNLSSMREAMPFFKSNYPNQFAPKDIKQSLG